MSEFNTASCGGIPGISDTFASALWTIDYTLQLALDDAAGQNGGYHAVYLHTRELNISYSLFLPWPGPETWKARPQFYAQVVTRAALTPFPALSGAGSDGNGSWVVEIGLGYGYDSQAAYAIYDVDQSSRPSSFPARLVLINYADNQTTFNIPSQSSNASQSWQNLSVIYLSAPSMNFSYDNNPSVEQNVTWGGRTLVNGTWTLLKSDQNWVGFNETMSCASGCQITLPNSGVAVAYVGANLPTDETGVKVAASGSISDFSRIYSIFAAMYGVIVSYILVV